MKCKFFFFSFQFNRQFALPGLFTILSGAWPCSLPPTKCSQPSWHLWMLCHCQLSICGWHGLPCLSLQTLQGIHIFNSSASLVLWVSGGRDSSLQKAGPPLLAEQDLGMHRIIDPWGLGGDLWRPSSPCRRLQMIPQTSSAHLHP